MGQVIVNATMSLDGFVALPDDTVGDLFDWYEGGEVEVRNAGELPPFHLTPPSAEYWSRWASSLGALVVGRTLFDITDGWHGTHPLDVPVVVVTHAPPTDWSYPGSERFTFATAGIEDAIVTAQRIAGERVVGVAAGEIGSQALAAGLVDAVAIDLAPVVLGAGKPFFTDPLPSGLLGTPEVVVGGPLVTHLHYPVQ